jgi:hypothetical protein
MVFLMASCSDSCADIGDKQKMIKTAQTIFMGLDLLKCKINLEYCVKLYFNESCANGKWRF